MFTKKKLKEICEMLLVRAKENLTEHPDAFAQTALFLKGNDTKPVLLDMSKPQVMHQMVQTMILTEKPDAVVLINDAWMRNTRGVEAANMMAQLQAGQYKREIHKHPERKECLVITAGCIFGTCCIIQPYHKEDGKIVFDARDEAMEKEGMFESSFFGHAWETLAGKGGQVH